MRLSRPIKNVFHNLTRKMGSLPVPGPRLRSPVCKALEESRDRQKELTPEERDAYLALGEDLQRVWSHESTPQQLRKRLLRAVLVEIIATIKGREIHLLLHWKGGRPHASGGASQPHRRAPVDHRCRDRRADPRSGPHAARRVDCRTAQPLA